MSSLRRVGGELPSAKGTGRVCPTSVLSQSKWMQDVPQGMEHSMGYDTEADHAIPINVLVAVMDYIKKDTEEYIDKLDANILWKIGTFICLLRPLHYRATRVLHRPG